MSCSVSAAQNHPKGQRMPGAGCGTGVCGEQQPQPKRASTNSIPLFLWSNSCYILLNVLWQ